MAMKHCSKHGTYSEEQGECPQCKAEKTAGQTDTEPKAGSETTGGKPAKNRNRKAAKDRNAGTRRKRPSES